MEGKLHKNRLLVRNGEKYVTPKYSRQTPDAKASEPFIYDDSTPPMRSDIHYAAARGFAQIIGLHPLPAVITFAANGMLFAGEVGSKGILLPELLPAGLVVACVIGVITYIAQKQMYGDTDSEALCKSLSLALLTAIPTGLPSLLTVPSAFVGFVRTLSRRRS
jgi:hypothetical protein